MFNVVLVEPEIPPNTGNIIRLCANTRSTLHLIEPLGFPIDHSKMRRAGLDYHELAVFRVHPNWESLIAAESPDAQRMFAISTRGKVEYASIAFQPKDWLVFGSETKGLGRRLETFAEQRRLRIPMAADNRSLNLSNAVAVVVYEAWRQIGFTGSE